MTAEFYAGSGEPDEAALFAAADSARRVIDALVRTRLPAERLAQVQGLLDRAEGLLTEQTRGEEEWNTRRYNAVAGLANPIAIPVLPVIEGEGKVRAEFSFGQAYEGPPGYAHGGAVAMVIDQLLGMANGAAGRPAMTARLTVNYRRPTVLNAPLTATGTHVGHEGRKVFAEARIEHDGQTVVDAEGLFVAPTQDQQWERFHGAMSEADQIG